MPSRSPSRSGNNYFDDPISLERVHRNRGIRLNTQMYSYNSMIPWILQQGRRATVPHSRRQLTSAEINAIMAHSPTPLPAAVSPAAARRSRPVANAMADRVRQLSLQVTNSNLQAMREQERRRRRRPRPVRANNNAFTVLTAREAQMYRNLLSQPMRARQIEQARPW